MSTVNKHKPAADISTPPANYTTLFFDENGDLYSKDEEGTLARYSPAGDASGITYSPDNSLLWTDSVDPGNVQEALDDLALRLNVVENDTAVPPDASEVTYTPSVLADWDGSLDPGQADEALDQLAERIADIEGLGLGANAFGTIAVSGQSDVVADTSSDTLNFASGAGIAITTNAGTDTVTFTCDVDASEVTFTPTNSIHWTDSEDPGDVDDALNDLAARVQALEEFDGGDGTDADAVGFRGIPQNAQAVNYAIQASDAGKHIYHATGAGAGDTYTLPANASIQFEVGTAITFINMATDAVTIAITTDTMYLAGTGTTGNRSLAQYGIATAIKVTSTEWLISGTGLT